MDSKNQLGGGVSRHEASQDPRQLWESAYAGTDIFGTREYLVLLARRDNPTQRIYATLEMGSLGTSIDIPLEEHTPEEVLRQRVNLHPTLWGDIDPEAYREATEGYSREDLLALLNRASTSADIPDHVPRNFYDMFYILHGKAYGLVRVSSHGGSSNQYGYDFNATLEPTTQEFHTDLHYEPVDVQIDQAMRFAEVVQASLPHLTVTPLPVDIYIQDVQAALGFLD